MLPGVGIFGSDPISIVLIQLLKHFEFEIHAIWTNQYEIDNSKFISTVESLYASSNQSNNNSNTSIPKQITTSIDNVLLNKNVNLVFVCCQPNLHSQISSKALGIGKGVVCLFPTCKSLDDILHMINSAHYYPSLINGCEYGGIRYLAEFKLVKQSLSLIGDIKLCNIVINCQSLINNKGSSNENTSSSKTSQQKNGNFMDNSFTSPSSINWLSDKDLGAGVLNRFGAAIISLILHLFDNKKVTKVYGCLKTFIEEMDDEQTNKFKKSKENSNQFSNYVNKSSNQIRKITADDFVTFQLNLEPCSIMVNVTINSLSKCKYSQEVVLCGSDGVLVWSNSKIVFKSSDLTKLNDLKKQKLFKTQLKPDFDNLKSGASSNDSNYETELIPSDQIDPNAETFLNAYKNIEQKHPELPYFFIRGLYYYLANLKTEFIERHKLNNNNNNENTANLNNITNDSTKTANLKSKSMFFNNSNSKIKTSLDTFEHMRIVQLIIKNINLSSESNRWVSVNY